MSQQETSEPKPRAAFGADLIIPVLGCGLTVYYLISTLDLVWEARATGTVIGLVLLALCIAHIARLGMRLAAGDGGLGFGDLFQANAFNRQRFALIAMVVVYVVTIYWVGATLGLFALLAAAMRLLGVTSLRTLLSVSFFSAALVHLALITLLDGKLPQGVILPALFRLFGGGA